MTTTNPAGAAPAPRIVVGVDRSGSSQAALRWAVRQAKLAGGPSVRPDP